MYRSKFEAYPFLSEKSTSLACDFEILSDEVTSKIGHLFSLIEDVKLREDLIKMGEILYHLNPTLRTKMSLTTDALDFVLEKTKELEQETQGRCKMFVLPFGCEKGAMSHIIRNNFKTLARMVYKHSENGGKIDELLLDFLGAMSDYFFHLSLYLNKLDGFDEIPFISKNYKL